MRTSADCTRRAEECRRLAKLAAQPEDWQHFIEMAATWDTLADQRKANKQVADELVAEEEVADQQVAAPQVADKQVADEQLAEEELAEEELAEEELADEQLAAILALAGAIANGRDLRLGPVD
jgi:hypothetical protein